MKKEFKAIHLSTTLIGDLLKIQTLWIIFCTCIRSHFSEYLALILKYTSVEYYRQGLVDLYYNRGQLYLFVDTPLIISEMIRLIYTNEYLVETGKLCEIVYSKLLRVII